MKTQIILLTKNKNEKDLEEWLKYHLAIGFDNITLYDNESPIDILNLIKRIKIQDKITYIKISNNELKIKKQQGIYNNHHTLSTYDWQLYIDDDEVLYLNYSKYKNIKQFLKNIPKNIKQFGIFSQCMSSNVNLIKRDDTQINTFLYTNIKYDSISYIKSFIRKNATGEFLFAHKINNEICYSFNGIIDDLIGSKIYDCSNDDLKIFHYRVKTYNEWNNKLKMNRADLKDVTYEFSGNKKFEQEHIGYNTLDNSLLKLKNKLLDLNT